MAKNKSLYYSILSESSVDLPPHHLCSVLSFLCLKNKPDDYPPEDCCGPVSLKACTKLNVCTHNLHKGSMKEYRAVFKLGTFSGFVLDDNGHVLHACEVLIQR